MRRNMMTVFSDYQGPWHVRQKIEVGKRYELWALRKSVLNGDKRKMNLQQHVFDDGKKRDI
jgi:hypothetical protein